jgi:large subunit ribosomal protein L4
VKLLKPLDWRSTLVIIAEDNRNLELSVRNIPTVAVRIVNNVSPVDLIRFDGILATDDAIRCFEESLV